MASTVPQDLTSLINPKLLWHHRVYIAVCLSVALLLGCVYLMVASPKYEVEARLVVENRGQPLDPTEESGDDFLPTQVEIIRSPAVIAEVVD